MYSPSKFKETDQKVLLQIMQDNAFAMIITTDSETKPVCSSLPFLIERRNGKIFLSAHFSKANPQWMHLEKNASILVVFQGPHCYISPSWYKKSGVPTWDYVTVHCYGAAKILNNVKTAELIETLSDKYEYQQENPWKAKNNYSSKMLNAIVGFEISVQEIQGKVKIGQNKSDEDLQGVMNALQNSDKEQEKEIAKLIKRYLESKD